MALLMVAKHLPAAYEVTPWAASARKEIVKAVSPAFMMSLLNPSKRGEVDPDTSRIMGMQIIAAFGLDSAIAVQFVPCLPVLLKLLRTSPNPAVVELALDCCRHLSFCKPVHTQIPLSKVLNSVQVVADRASSGALLGWQDIGASEFVARCTQMVDDLVSAGASAQAMHSAASTGAVIPTTSPKSSTSASVGTVAAAAILRRLPAELVADDRDSAVHSALQAADQLELLTSMYEFDFPAADELHALCIPVAQTALKLLHSDLEASHKSAATRIATCTTAMAGPAVWLHKSILPSDSHKHGRWAPLLLLLQLWGVELKLLLDAVDECCLAAWPEEGQGTGDAAVAGAASALTAAPTARHGHDASPSPSPAHSAAGDDDSSDDEAPPPAVGATAGDDDSSDDEAPPPAVGATAGDDDSSDDEAPPPAVGATAGDDDSSDDEAPPPAVGATESKQEQAAPKRPSAATVPSEAFNWRPGEELPVRLRPPSDKRKQEVQVAPRGVADRCRVLARTLQRAKYGLLPLLRCVDSSVLLLLQASDPDAPPAQDMPVPTADALGMFRGALQEIMKIIVLHIGEYFAMTAALGLVLPEQRASHAEQTARSAVGLAYASPLLLAVHDCLLEYAAVDCAGLQDDLVSSVPALLQASSDALQIVQGPLTSQKSAEALLAAARLPLVSDTPPLHEWVKMLHDVSQALLLPAAHQWVTVSEGTPELLGALARQGAEQPIKEWMLHWSRQCALAGMASQHRLASGAPEAPVALPSCIAAPGLEAACAVAQSLLDLKAAVDPHDTDAQAALVEGNKVASWLLLCADAEAGQQVPGVPQGVVHLVTSAGCLADERWQCAVGDLYQLTSAPTA